MKQMFFSADALLGEQVDSYVIERVLGGGGMGVVFRARDEELDRPVALKLIHFQYANNDASRQRFRREARALAKLSHPNIVQVYALRKTRLGLFLVMEYVDGPTLETLLTDETALPWPRAVSLIRPLLEALEYAHTREIVHRDIKPGNILVAHDGTVKVVDFGLAKIAEHTRLTRQGTTMGTPAYMSPEQTRGDEVDRRTDLWSVGVMLYQMVTGRRPFRGGTEQSIINAILAETPVPVEQLQPDVPAALGRVIEKALQKNLGARYDSAAAMRADLDALEDASPETVPGDSGQTRILAPSRGAAPRRKLWRAVLAIAAVVVLVVAGYFALPRFLPSAEPESSPSSEAEAVPPPSAEPPEEAAPAETPPGIVPQNTEAPARTEPSVPEQERAEPPTLAVPAPGTLRFTSTPAGAVVFIDGTRRGTTPRTLADLPPARYAIEFRLDGHAPHQETVRLGAGETRTVRARLAELMGTLTVSVRPWGRLFIDGTLVGEEVSSRQSFEVSAARSHTVVAEHPDLGRQEHTVTVQPGATQALDIDLRE